MNLASHLALGMIDGFVDVVPSGAIVSNRRIGVDVGLMRYVLENFRLKSLTEFL